MNQPLPEWMDTPSSENKSPSFEDRLRHELAKPRGNANALIELEKQTFEIAFETALEEMAGGTTLTYFCQNYHTPISPTRFRTWIFRDKGRKNAYLVAKALAAEQVEDDLIRIADGIGPDGQAAPEDTGRSKLRIDTRLKLLAVWNRRRYGDIKQIEQKVTSTVDLSALSTEELKAQLLTSLGFGENAGSTIDIDGEALSILDEADDDDALA